MNGPPKAREAPGDGPLLSSATKLNFLDFLRINKCKQIDQKYYKFMVASFHSLDAQNMVAATAREAAATEAATLMA